MTHFVRSYRFLAEVTFKQNYEKMQSELCSRRVSLKLREQIVSLERH